jgi:hypothetical protein
MKKTKNAVAVPVDDWQAKDDMRTLMRAAAIRRDPSRLKAAQAAARKQLDEQQAETAQMRALAKPK